MGMNLREAWRYALEMTLMFICPDLAHDALIGDTVRPFFERGWKLRPPGKEFDL
jgi:hypothetical protein